VLLKNEGGLLPLSKAKIKSVATLDLTLSRSAVGGGSARVEPFFRNQLSAGLSNYLGTAVQVHYARGVPSLGEMGKRPASSTAATEGKPGLNAEYFNNNDLQGTPAVKRTEQHVNFRAGTRADFSSGDDLIALDRLLCPARVRLI